MVFICKIYKYRVLPDKYPTSGPAWRAGTYFFRESSGHVMNSLKIHGKKPAGWNISSSNNLTFVGSVACISLGRRAIAPSPMNKSNTHVATEHLSGWNMEEESHLQNRAIKNTLWEGKVLKQADLYIQSLTNRSVCSCRYNSRTFIFFGRRQKHGCWRV